VDLDAPVVDHHLVGLVRVSTDAQDAQMQRDALVAAGCGRIFEEKVSTRATERPGLAGELDHLRPDAGDTLVVWKLDRLGRSIKDLLTIADDLHSRGIGLRILTGTLARAYMPTGEKKFFFTMMAAFAELERDMIHERTTMAGLAAARRQGRVGGRPSVMDGDKLAAAKARRAAGQSPTQIAEALGISRATVYRVASRHLPREAPGHDDHPYARCRRLPAAAGRSGRVRGARRFLAHTGTDGRGGKPGSPRRARSGRYPNG
jgi:DNA invertase Pin-like site-specific DNA recombinase